MPVKSSPPTITTIIKPTGKITPDTKRDTPTSFIVRYDYDEYGRLVGSRYYDDKGLAMHSPDGYASFRDVLDENGFLIKRTFYDADTNPVKIHNYVYDDAMNIIEIKEE